MLMCVILLWPSKIIYSLILMQNMFNVWVVEDKLFQKCVFGRSGLNTSVFEKHFISYSCILFIKYYTLRSFYLKLLCFSKICFFFVQIFSLLMQLFMGYIVSCLHLLKERIFFLTCIINLVFKFGLCVFIFPS